MRHRSVLFIFIFAFACLLAFLTRKSGCLASFEQHLSRVIRAVPHSLNLVAPQPEPRTRQAQYPVTEAAAAAPTTLARIIRVPAIREAQNYGWIQLPRGTRVDVVEEQRDGFLIRYDENYIVVPRAAVKDGSVVLREHRGGAAS